MYRIIHWKRRPFVYAFVISVGFALLLDTLRNAPAANFVYASMVLYLILLFELFTTKYYADDILTQFKLPPVESRDRNVQAIHHLILPSLVYFGLVAFVFFNNIPSLDLLIITLVFTLFTVLFTNVRAYYEDKFKLEHATHSIYDIINLVSIFVVTDGVLNLFNYFSLNQYFTIPAILVIFLVLSIMVLMRYHMLNKDNLKILTLIFFVLLVGMGAFVYFAFAFFVVSFLVSLLYYYQLAYYNHLRDDTFSKEILFEYIVVFFILIVLIIGIS